MSVTFVAKENHLSKTDNGCEWFDWTSKLVNDWGIYWGRGLSLSLCVCVCVCVCVCGVCVCVNPLLVIFCIKFLSVRISFKVISHFVLWLYKAQYICSFWNFNTRFQKKLLLIIICWISLQWVLWGTSRDPSHRSTPGIEEPCNSRMRVTGF